MTTELPLAIQRRNQSQGQNKKRLRHSAFFVTLNSNQSVQGMAAAEADQFKKRFFSVCKDILKNQSSLWVRIKEPGVVYSPEVIRGLQIGPACIEVGPQNGRIHIHCIGKRISISN